MRAVANSPLSTLHSPLEQSDPLLFADERNHDLFRLCHPVNHLLGFNDLSRAERSDLFFGARISRILTNFLFFFVLIRGIRA